MIKTSNLAIVIITKNEEKNLDRLLKNIKHFSENIIVVDSFSTDNTEKVAKSYNTKFIKNKFINFGKQWNFAISNVPKEIQWTMKLDADEFLSDELKLNIYKELNDRNSFNHYYLKRKNYFLGKPILIKDNILRIWKTGSVKFSNVEVNEHPIISGKSKIIKGDLLHFDSNSFREWINKQNFYSDLELRLRVNNLNFAAKPKIFGNKLERRMFFKKYFYKLPLRYHLFFIYNFFLLGAWKSGIHGFRWALMRNYVMRLVEYKLIEYKNNNIGG